MLFGVNIWMEHLSPIRSETRLGGLSWISQAIGCAIWGQTRSYTKRIHPGGLTIVQRFYWGSIQKKSYQCHHVVMQFEAFILLPFCLAFCKLPCPRSHTILSRFRALVWNRFIFKNPFLICFKFHHHFQIFIFPTFLTQPTFPYLSLILK